MAHIIYNIKDIEGKFPEPTYSWEDFSKAHATLSFLIFG